MFSTYIFKVRGPICAATYQMRMVTEAGREIRSLKIERIDTDRTDGVILVCSHDIAIEVELVDSNLELIDHGYWALAANVPVVIPVQNGTAFIGVEPRPDTWRESILGDTAERLAFYKRVVKGLKRTVRS